jgi:adenosine deaminase
MEGLNEDKKIENPVEKPKTINKYIDLHFHLDGSIVLPIAKELGRIQNIKLPGENDEELEKHLSVESAENLSQFLKCFELPLELLQTEIGITESIKLVANNIKSQGVIYVEMRFAPQFHTKKGLNQEKVIQAAIKGKNEASIKVNLILCFIRRKNNKKENEETLRLAKEYFKTGDIVAVDIAGDEENNPIKDYKDLFDKCKEYGIPFTIHAGEAAGPESVKNAINLGAKRIGHGTRAFTDNNVVELIREKGIFLEMCPTSNEKTKALDNMDDFPFMNYLNKGIKVTLNTDDMAIARTTLANEFRYMEEKFGLNYEQEKIIISNSIDAAFATDDVKQWLRKEFGL